MPQHDQAILDAVRNSNIANPGAPVLQYEGTLAEKNKQFTSPVAPPTTYTSLGQVTGIEKYERGAQIRFENGYMRLAYLLPDLLQVRVRPDNNFGDLLPFSYAVLNTGQPEVEPTVVEDAEAIVVGAGNIACRIARADGHFSMFAPDGSPILANAPDGFAWSDKNIKWTRFLADDENCHGLGERASGFNLRGQQLALWHQDPVLYQRGEDPIYYAVPFYFGLQAKYSIGILWDNPARGKVDLGKTQPNFMTFEAEGGELRFYIMVGITPDIVMDRYTGLTGRPYMPPLWALGYHQARWSYENSAKMRDIARQFRQRGIPCDVLYFDIDYMDQFCCFTWNNQNFADLATLVPELNKQGFKSVCILDPGIRVGEDVPVYQDGKAADIFIKYPDGTEYNGVVWPGMSAFPDFSSEKGREWWAKQVASFLTQIPFAGIWNDMNEPVVFRTGKPGTFPDYIEHDWEGKKVTHVEGGHNTYGMLMARSTREGLEKAYPEKRPFTLTRDGWAGTQRYASSWTGDNLSTWDHLKLSITMLLNLGLSGVPFTGPDIGGFGGEKVEPELYTRWMQLGSVLPYFRSHTIKDSAPQEPWSHGGMYEQINKKYIELRYRLLPYFYSVMAFAHQQGLPFIRPAFFVDRNDPELRKQEDAFMVGENMFVAPVVEPGVSERTVYLPRGVWYDFWTNKLIDGARQVTVNAPLDTMPIFYRAGRVLPMWPLQQYVGERTIDELTLRVYAGPGETTIYEDEGEGKGYQQGEYRFSYFTAGFFPNGQYGIDWRTAGKYKPPYEKMRIELIGIPGEPQEITVDRKPAPMWFFESGVLEVLTPPFKEMRLGGRRSDDNEPSAKTVVRRPGS